MFTQAESFLKMAHHLLVLAASMRRFILAFPGIVLLSVLPSQAGPLPLTIKDVNLMLRSGYSSQTVLKELATRHFADSLDADGQNALRKAGASQELIAALEKGTYSVSAEEVVQVKAKLTSQAKERAALAEESAIQSARYQDQRAKDRAAGMQNFQSGNTTYDYLKGSLVKLGTNSLTRADDDSIGRKKIIAYYFSASWCKPCRKFTPQLVEYYNRVAPQHPEFEVVLYSQDKSAADMENYMRQENMPWPAIDFAKRGEKPELIKAAGPGIPALVVVESSGKLISSSYDGQKYLGNDKVLADLDAVFSGSVAQAH